jgi:hypothetical protein
VDLDYRTGIDPPVVASMRLEGNGRIVSTSGLWFSPNAGHVVIGYESTESGSAMTQVLDVDVAAGRITPHDFTGSVSGNRTAAEQAEGFLPLKFGHPVFVRDRNGELHFVGNSGSWQGQVIAGVQTLNGKVGGVLALNLRTNTYRSLTDAENEAAVAHVSASPGSPGYVFVSYDSSSGGTKYRGELIAVSLSNPSDSETAVVRLAHHRTNATNFYQGQAHLVPSPDGRYLMFSSTWGESQSVVSTYVIDLEPLIG